MGNILWIILGTTTFGLAVLHAAHYFDNIWDRVFIDDQEEKEQKETKDELVVTGGILGNLASSILSHGLGVKFDFQKGFVLPELKDGKLRFRNVKITSNGDKSFTFTANVEAMEITLSFNKWYEGNGLIYDLEVFGMHGVICKKNTDVQPLPMQQPIPIDMNTSTYLKYNDHYHYQYDLYDYHFNDDKVEEDSPNYQLEHVKIHDSYFEVYNDELKNNTPLKVTIFGCDLPKLRRDRVLIDFFNANNVSGALNDSMFTIHKRQDNLAIKRPDNSAHTVNDNIIRFKINGINLGGIAQSNPSSSLNWIVNGRAEIIADITLPSLDDETLNFVNEYKRIGDVVSDVIGGLVTATSNEISTSAPVQEESDTLLKSALTAIYHTFSKPENAAVASALSEYVLVNVKVKFTDLRASVPTHLPVASSTGAPFISLQNLRSLISFVNNYADANSSTSQDVDDFDKDSQSPNSTATPNPFAYAYPIIIKTTVIEKLSDLYNITNLSQTKILDSIVSDIYEDLLKMAQVNEQQIMHEKANLWSHSIASQLLLLGLGAIV